jgi:hypothetical protein
MSIKSRAKCLACPLAIGLFRRMNKQRFCCDQHEVMYLAELKDMGVARLRTAGIRLKSLQPAGALV